MTITIVCELDVISLTWQQARVFEDALRQASAEVFPKRRIKGLWVHRMAQVETYEEALQQFRDRWTRAELDIEEARQLLPEGWEVQEQTVPGFSSALRVFCPLDEGKWQSVYAHTLDEVWAFVEKHMEKPKRQPRRMKMTGRAFFEMHGMRLPAAYLCNVTNDVWGDVFNLDPFRGDCINPHCDEQVTSRFASPWCKECGELLGSEWRQWFWSAFHTGKGEKAVKKMIKVVFS